MALNLGKVLGSTLVAHPSLFQELPGLLAALDEGKQIFLQDSQDPLQHAMIVVLRALPTNCSSKSLWTKGECSSLRSFILDELLTSSYIIQPQNLAVHERLAVISAKSLLHMLENHPEILSDLTSLFENLLDGEGLDLSGLENLELREELISFLRQVGLRNTDGVFQLSEKAEDQSSRKAIKLILSSLRIKSSWNHSPEEAKQVVHVESSQSVEIFSNHQGQIIESSSEEEGPSPYIGIQTPIDPATSISESFPIGSTFENPSNMTETVPHCNIEEIRHPFGREEWLLTPGERKPFGETVSASTIGNRKFDKGKLSKKAAEILNAESEREYLAYLQSEEGRRTEELLRDHREKRGRALVELHQESTSKKPKSGIADQFFDRDRDLLSHRKLDRRQVEDLIDNARLLDSRFSRTAVQRTFL